jgi:hypothetical protein
MPGVGGRFEFLLGTSPDTGFTHNPGNAVLAATDALIGKIPVNFR